MERRKIKVGETYAYKEHGNINWGTAEPIRVLDLAHEFQVKIPRRLGQVQPQEYRTEVGLLAVRLDKIGNPLGEPFHLKELRRVVRTWAEEVQQREAFARSRAALEAEWQRQADQTNADRDRLRDLIGGDHPAIQHLRRATVSSDGIRESHWAPTVGQIVEMIQTAIEKQKENG